MRAIFKRDPETMSEEEFSKLVAEAIWIKQFELDIIEQSVFNAIARHFPEE